MRSAKCLLMSKICISASSSPKLNLVDYPYSIGEKIKKEGAGKDRGKVIAKGLGNLQQIDTSTSK